MLKDKIRTRPKTITNAEWNRSVNNSNNQKLLLYKISMYFSNLSVWRTAERVIMQNSAKLNLDAEQESQILYSKRIVNKKGKDIVMHCR